MDYNDPIIIRQILLDNFKHPHFKVKVIDNDFTSLRVDSPYCIDDITMGLKIKEDVVVKAVFMGVGCTISIAAANIICEQIEGKKIDQVCLFIEAFSQMLINGEITNSQLLDKAIVFKNTLKQPSRIKCAEVGLSAIKHIIKQGGKNE